MSLVETVSIQCPYCGENIDILVDTSAGDQSWIEDCSVCCHPINFHARVVPGEPPEVRAWGDDESG
jgi:hypothetical protein